MIRLVNTETNEVRHVSDAEAAEAMGLSLEELQWALEEYGHCTTEEWYADEI
jgi:hypothetical protein